MAVSEVALCNLALFRIGHLQTIRSLADTSAEAQACAVLYPHARDQALSARAWLFASKRAELAELPATVPPTEWSGWGYGYRLPADVLVVRGIWTGVRRPSPDWMAQFALEHHEGETVLLTNLDAVELHYTARIVTTTLFSPGFDDVLAWKLASELALAVPGKAQLAAGLMQQYEIALARASATDYRQGNLGPPPEAEHIRAR